MLIRRIPAVVLTVAILFTTVFALSISASALTFTPRYSMPNTDNEYYYSSKNPFYSAGYGLPNCTAYAYASVHEDFMKGRITLIGCPKLDAVDYSEKLTEIIKNNDIQEVTVLRMEVPCCGGLEMAVKKALKNSGKSVPCRVVTISIEGDILE